MYSNTECPLCEKVNSVIFEGRNKPPPGSAEKNLTVVGTFAEIRQSEGCDVCRFIVERLTEGSEWDPYKDHCPVRFWRWDPPSDYLFSFGPIEGETNCLTCDLDHRAFTLVDLEPADLDPDWIDLDRVCAWATSCDAEHAGKCHTLTEWTSTPPPSLAPLLLVDVISKCLIEIPIDHVPDIRYAALSYVWGQLQGTLETITENVQDLCEKHALASPSYSARIPDTVRDAIELVYRLGIPYLWVDRLCIIQDDLDKKSPQLEQMGAIYASAYLTLVAADGDDANHGLRGSCPGIASPRILEPALLAFSPGEKPLISEPNFALRTGPGHWHRRGWTFQERTLSNRNLVFQQGRVFWECRGALWTEEIAYGPQLQPDPSGEARALGNSTNTVHQGTRTPRNQNTKPSAYSIELSRWPDLHSYEILVRTYSELNLSFPTDGLRAFTGVLNTLSRTFPGGMLYGVPEYFFDYAIMWVPHIPIRRRLAENKAVPSLPSWSWVGWEGGGINLSIAPTMRQPVNTTRGIMPWENVEVYPTVNWRKTDLDTGTSHAINNGYHKAASARKDKSTPLPEGWSRASVTQNGSTTEGFVHDELPRDFFLWPLEIAGSSSGAAAGKRKAFRPYLEFQTSRAFLSVGARLEPEWEEKVWSVAANAVAPRVWMFNLHDNRGNWAGVLESNGAGEVGATGDDACECIVVSGGHAWRDTDDEQTGLEEWAQVDVIKSLAKYEFYNVLSIGWEQGVAYRKAAGRVWKEAWERLDTSRVDITLG
ncbi:putative heterokaryon incompatibility protein [Rosellinia necatrix]|uniref:Putative heterokaryon incompatibility protein n=1 Tax=Rosellinia necatrix TaxID=77044 RepID=A0A1W2TW59_ROSNE|nr:putative heterokaryon incompatibility protein [Rosellinia necatrix]